MLRLKVPVICIIIGEGASGGAMGIGVGDKVYMMANTWYTVISPESCSSILWRSWEQKEKAAEELKLTSDHMLGFGLVDGVIPEPIGGAHWNHEEAADMVKKQILSAIKELKHIDPETRIDERIEKFSKMGRWEEQTN
jgi:acetyl-CoA carboxylase carboxyl transferase subunit alpha